MKKCKKVFAFTLSVLLAFACYAVPAFASSSASQYGLEATIVTDKESYKANEEIHVTVTVKNTNDFKVENVSMESLLPETLTLKDGSSSTKTVDLEPGETLTLSFTAVKEKEETSATEPESQSTEPTETEPVIPSESQTVKPSESESVKPTVGTIDTAIDDSTTVFPKEVTEMNSATIIHSNNPNTGDITSIKTVELPKNLMRIGTAAFSRSGLSSIDIPDSVTQIGSYAFSECKNLKKISFPKGLTRLNDSFFSYCESLTDIEIPDSITYIGRSAFEYCTNLKNVTLPQNLSEISNGMFSGCSTLTDITA